MTFLASPGAYVIDVRVTSIVTDYEKVRLQRRAD